jgi:multiple sugar transport system substrate-binding protein
MSEQCLRGITWNHSRALPPLVAASQRFEETHPDVTIAWEKRSLDEFGHAQLLAFAQSFDLLIVDHPMLGEVHRDRTLLDLRPLLPADALADLESDSAGPSWSSYFYEGCLYALPVDAAAPAASFRPDLLERAERSVPSTWDELMALSRLGLVSMPGFPVDLFLNFMGMCVSRGGVILGEDRLFRRNIALGCLDELRELASSIDESFYGLNPIALYEAMSGSDRIAYCPFAYTYSNYARPGFADHAIHFTNPIALRGGAAVRTILGGTGIAISAHSAMIDLAVEFSLFVAGRVCQTSLYGVCGGQPARHSAWRDPLLNRLSNCFFANTLASIETAYVRPRYPGYIALQRKAGLPIIDFLRGGITADRALEHVEQLYRRSLAL